LGVAKIEISIVSLLAGVSLSIDEYMSHINLIVKHRHGMYYLLFPGRQNELTKSYLEYIMPSYVQAGPISRM